MADSFGYGLGQTLGGINEWWKTLRNPSAPESPAARYLPRQDYIGREIDPVGDSVDEFGRSFGAGFSGAPDPMIEGQRQALRNMGQPQNAVLQNPGPMVSAPGTGLMQPASFGEGGGTNLGLDAGAAADAYRRGLQRRSLSEAMFGNTDGPGTAPAFDPPPPPPNDSHVSATINGQTFEYGGGQAGGAPTLGGIGDKLGEQWSNVVSDSTREFSQPGIGHGTYSQLTANPSMASIGQLRDERELADAQPTGDSLGYTRGDLRNLDTGLRTKMADEQARGAAQINVAREKMALDQAQQKSITDQLGQLDAEASRKLAEFRASARYQAADMETRAKAEEALMSDLMMKRQQARENIGMATGRINVQMKAGDPSAGFGSQ